MERPPNDTHGCHHLFGATARRRSMRFPEEVTFARVTSEQPPTAKRVPHERTHHGDTVVDEYAWLQQKDDPDTVAYLEAENAFTTAATAHLEHLRETAFNEIKTRTKETDLSVPTRKGGFWYYTRTEAGKQYGIHCRVPVAEGKLTPPEG